MITINLEKAKEIGHAIRRELRAAEFYPYDAMIAAQIPNPELPTAEQKRQEIRDKYAAVQEQIDAAVTPEEIKTALGLS